jgi:threonine dehydrogenase-like Zn-dependent dehydrogenase
MKAWAVVPGTSDVRVIDRPEPRITKPDEVQLRVVRVGICGTDREEAAGGRALAPAGSTDLVIGHEMLGQVVEIGSAVSTVRPGDHGVFTVRRGCDTCEPCARNRSDMCRTGQYRERGIWGLDGYQAESVIDQEQYLVRVPTELADVAVLTEPLSVAEKAIDEAVRVQLARLPDAGDAGSWLTGRRCLVAGLGPIGLLAAMILRLRGAEVLGLDVVPADSPRPRWLSSIGGRYVNGREVTLQRIAGDGPIDVLVEAAGIATLEFALVEVLAPDAVYVLTGLPGGDRPLSLSAAELVRHLVLGNQVMIGSVNASRDHFTLAVEDLERARARWGGLVSQLITHRHPVTEAAAALQRHSPDEIKTVIEWTA